MTEPPEAERALGMQVYATAGDRCPGVAKTREDDFRVEELLRLEPTSASGTFPLYRVQKSSVDTMHMEKEMAGALKSRISLGGLKDKRSRSVQYVTPTSRRAERPERVEGRNFVATLVGFLEAPLSRSSLAGNRFEITLRRCGTQVGARVEEAFEAARSKRVPNFYGMQRFGSVGASHLVGRSIVKREFQEAVRTLLLSGAPAEANEAFESGNFQALVQMLPSGQDTELIVARRLVKSPGDWVGALRGIPIRLRRLYVHAYESYVFNLTLSRCIAEGEDISRPQPGDNWMEASEGGLKPGRVHGVREPLVPGAHPAVQIVGYAFRDYGSRFDRRIVGLLEEERVTPGMFFVDEMQEVSAEGGFRRPHMTIAEESFEAIAGEATLRFALAKGEYATVLLREVLKPEDPVAAGLG